MSDIGPMSGAEREQVQRGLRMASPRSAESLAAERLRLAELESLSPLKRTAGYLRLVGPGYLQSAMTLGGGTAVNALLAGALFGYALLWVAPIAMIIGLIMLAAVSYQTLSTGMRPFEAMRRHAGPFFAWGWALGALVASIIWHFPQYALASACLADLGAAVGIDGLRPQWLSFAVLAWAIPISMLYGSSSRLLRWYERLLKYMVWGIVLCFAWVVIRTGVDDWGGLLRGFVAFETPSERNGVRGVTLVLGGLAAAVGINMVFLYPYSLLARGWGREHRRLARFDLVTGMVVPYVLASSLIVIAAANTIHLDPAFQASRITPLEAAQSLAEVVGPRTGRLVFGLGVLGMALSTITLHMLCAGFVCSELFGWPFGGWRYRLATLVPAVGVLGPVFWSEYAVWLAVPTSILCGFLLPVAYIGFILLQRRRAYLGDDLPEGPRGRAWLGAMVVVTLFFVTFFGWSAWTRGRDYLGTLLETPEVSMRLDSSGPDR